MASEVNDVRDPRNQRPHVFNGVISITIFLTDGKDFIQLHTKFPSPFEAAYDVSFLTLEFEATQDMGEKYVKANFPLIPYKILNTRHKWINSISLVDEDGSRDLLREGEKGK